MRIAREVGLKTSELSDRTGGGDRAFRDSPCARGPELAVDYSEQAGHYLWVTADRLARTEAVKRRRDVILCRRNPAGSACATGADWSVGWLVRPSGGGGRVLKIWEDRSGNMAVTDSTGKNITFTSTGMASAGDQNFRVKPSTCIGNQLCNVTVTPSGFTSSKTGACLP
jgi:hypothetical protein